MKLDKVVSWYQRKISTYDKQQWEKTIEQRILHGFVQVPLTNTELKTDLIDVDLVRGSSFPKAKPKQGLCTVFKLAVLRYLFLPVYARWWVEQTSPRVFTLLLILYGLQMWCWGVYSYNIHRIASNATTVAGTDDVANGDSSSSSSSSNSSSSSAHEHIVGTIDLLVPMALSLVMSMMHSQIVATASISNETGTDGQQGGKRKAGVAASSKRRRHQHHGQSEQRQRRKRKIHQRGSELKFPLTADPANPKMGTVYIHQPPAMPPPVPAAAAATEQLVERISDADDTVATVTSTAIPEPIAPLRRRIVNFSPPNAPVVSSLAAPYQPQSETPPEAHAEASGVGSPPAASHGGADSSDTDDDAGGDGDEELGGRSLLLQLDSSGNTNNAGQFTEGTTSATEWIGITTNSEEENSYTTDLDASEASENVCSDYAADCDFAPTVILNPCCGTNDRISCTIWEHSQTKKAQMSVLDISSAIIARVDAIPDTCEYVYIGLALSILLSLVPVFCRICDAAANLSNTTELQVLDIPAILMDHLTATGNGMLVISFGSTSWEQSVLMVCLLLRICLTFLFFFVLAVAERAYKQRFLYAKLFSHLTSSRRARKSKVPHFRLNKVRNIKIWLSVRSYLKRRGPQRSVDVIVSAAFLLCLLFLSFLSVEFLKDSVHYSSQSNLEALTWSCCLGCFLLRFMTLGTKITRKYRSLSVLITEQINLYLQIEQKPHKKEELMVANSVLKLAADLLKELESPFKISGLSANPYLYTTIKVVILSAMSGVLSEMLGFKLKLHKIKIK